MNILLLSNSAPNYHYFFNALARECASAGARVVVATDSNYSREIGQLDRQGFNAVHVFADHFRTHRTDFALLNRYARFDLNAALLSDFERAEAYGVHRYGTGLDFYDRLRSALLSFFEAIFDQHDITHVLYENISNSFAHFAWFVAQRRGARYLGLMGSRLPGRFHVMDDPVGADAVCRAFEDIRSGRRIVPSDQRSWVRSYIAGIETIVPDYMRQNGLDRLRLLGRYLRWDRPGQIARLLRHATEPTEGQFQIGNPLRTHAALFARNLRRRLRAGRVRKLYDRPVEGERFLLYPLHFHPESSTSVLAGPWLNEAEVIRNIAFNLPEGMRLYVKDHASAWAFPSLDFYQRLKRLPNLRLLPPEAPTKTLIRRSVAVITLTSTVGWEALVMGRRVLLYGRVFYQGHRGVTRVTDLADLRRIIEATAARAPDWDAAYTEDFVAAYHATSLPGTLNLVQGVEYAAEMAAEVHRAMAIAGLVPQGIQADRRALGAEN